ncbi:MAG: lysozyme inhibitor LprI family protein [Pseudomonadota bacterium]
MRCRAPDDWQPIALVAAVAVAALTKPALAQDITFTPSATAACLASEAPPRTCIGQSAEFCMEESPGGWTTVGMSACTWAEVEYWDDRLNAAYTALLAAHEAHDAENARLGITAPSLTETLRDMQRSWIPHRDANCAYERAWWGGGTGQGPAGAACMLQMTGEQALELESWLVDVGR